MLKPTVLGQTTQVENQPEPPTQVVALSETNPALSNNMVVEYQAFPVGIPDEMAPALQASLEAFDLAATSGRDISQIGFEHEQKLHQTLDKFLAQISSFDNPKIFKLVNELKNAVDQQNLPELADRILNGKKSGWDTVKGWFSKPGLGQALDQVWEETRRLVSGRTKNLVDIITRLEKDLQTEKLNLEKELLNMEQLKAAYQKHFYDFLYAAAQAHGMLQLGKMQASQYSAALDSKDLLGAGKLQEINDKLQALESRALALEGVLTRLPADQLVIRQLQSAGVSTLQEVTTTASSRFANIKMTLLTLHQAMVQQNVQKLAQQGAELDNNLLKVRSQLMKEVVETAANAPGDNRLAQAEQIRQVVSDTESLLNIVQQAQQTNHQKFDSARGILETARSDMLKLASQLHPEQKVNY